MTPDEILRIIEEDGLYYAITEGVPAEDVEDIELYQMWIEAQCVLRAIEDHLEI